MEAGMAKLAARVYAEAKIAKATGGGVTPTLKGVEVSRGGGRIAPLKNPARQAAQRVGPHHERPIPWVGRKPKTAL